MLKTVRYQELYLKVLKKAVETVKHGPVRDNFDLATSSTGELARDKSGTSVRRKEVRVGNGGAGGDELYGGNDNPNGS